ncbi:MAG: hypothetical protein JST15_14250 [Bacteroidetes bacterium]|nr:hypothetical protein [Bacteroidota bacterium]
MNHRSLINRIFILSLFLVSFLFFGGAVKYFQIASFNNNGSGIISLTYSAKTSEVKSSKYLIGNLPFAQDKINDYFNSDVTKVTKAIVYKDKTDTSLTSVNVELSISNLNKLPEAKAFNDVEARWLKSDTGMVFSWLFKPAHAKTNSIYLYQIKVAFEGDIRSTSGVIKGKEADWYVPIEKMDPRGAYFVATINSDGTTQNTFSASGKEIDASKNTVSGTNKESGEKKTITDSKTEEKKTGGCGLFAFEFPIILLGGLVISKIYKRLRS